ncbi:hypothetical protein K492DRAFT_171772 [Lichtheimia hyalospora FSU 10163]|nr:hypothetical protein K492DRAFT_171772 [Lichtheimia hyalospora FSU 10163]
MKQQQQQQQHKDLEGFGLVILLLVVRRGCHCINLYCLKGDAAFPSALAPSALAPSALAPSALVPNAIKL